MIVVLGILWPGWVLANYYSQIWQWLVSGRSHHIGLDGDAALPFLSVALGRDVSGVLGAGLLVASAAIIGLVINKLVGWSYDSWRERLAYAVAIGIGAFTTLALVLALVGFYRTPILRVLVLAPLMGAVVWWVVRRPQIQWSAIRLPARARREWLWLACTGLALLCAFVAALAPEHEYDALWYHLAYPQRFLAQGWLVDLSNDYVSLYPMAWELWFGYGLAVSGQTAATLLHFACLPLTAMITYDLAHRFAPGASPALAVAIFATVPTVMWEASTAYIDLALAFHVTLVVYAVLRYAERRRFQWLVLATLNLGIALASKHLALVVLGLACGGLVVRLYRAERNLWPALRPALVLGSLSLLLPLPWYLRSLHATGNPFFPELYQVFGAPAERWDGVTAQGLQRFLDHFGQPRTFFNQLTLPWHITMHAAAYDGSLGPLFLMLLPFLGLRRWTDALLWLLAFVVGFIACWASPLASFQLRFLVPIMPTLAVLAAAGFAGLKGFVRIVAGRRGATIQAIGCALLLMLNLPPFTSLHQHDREGRSGWLNSTLHDLPLGVVIGAESRAAYLARALASYRVWSFANQALPADARILTWSGGDEYYAQRDHVWANAAAVRDIAWAGAGSEAQALSGLHALGITHLIVDRRPPDSQDAWEQYALTSLAVRQMWYETLYEDSHYVLYRVRWEQRVASPRGTQS